jgi:hypothetical protein
MALIDMACERLTIHLLVDTHPMERLFMAPFLAQAVVVSHGVVVVAGSSVAAEDSVVGSGKS